MVTDKSTYLCICSDVALDCIQTPTGVDAAKAKDFS